MADCPIVGVQAMGRFWRMAALRIAGNKSFAAASSLGKLPRVLMMLRSDLVQAVHGICIQYEDVGVTIPGLVLGGSFACAATIRDRGGGITKVQVGRGWRRRWAKRMTVEPAWRNTDLGAVDNAVRRRRPAPVVHVSWHFARVGVDHAGMQPSVDGALQ